MSPSQRFAPPIQPPLHRRYGTWETRDMMLPQKRTYETIYKPLLLRQLG